MRTVALLLSVLSCSSIWGQTDAAQPVTATELDLLPGFHAERLYLVPRDKGSWVSMAFSPQGNLIVSPEGGGLFRVDAYRLGTPKRKTKVTKLKTKLGTAHGLHFVGNALYAVSGGVVRLSDTTADGEFDQREMLLEIQGRGEHGPHVIVPGPSGKWLYVIAGNATTLPSGVTRDRVSSLRGASQHTPPGPQGWVMRISPDGKQRELFALGLRNSFGLAFDPRGELFTYDSDNEGFMGLPWYRPTNVYHIVSGADFGWRQSSKNLMPYYPDNLPPVLEVGPGSPTGMVFGTQTKFPERYRRALFVNDWSYGRIYAIHLKPQGAGYQATQEFFVSGRPLAVTDLRVGKDGALYFLTGGRGTQSALYRLTYTEKHDAASVQRSADATPTKLKQLRTKLESYHGRQDPNAVEFAWAQLKHVDRTIRFSARTAIEHQKIDSWLERAFEESDTTATMKP